jgi:hypothetical protein
MGRLEDQVAHYEVQIIRTGDGAQQAVQAFRDVDRAAAVASHSGDGLNQALHRIHESSLLGRNGLHSLNGVLALAGEHHFPALTESIMSAHGALGAIRGTSEATGISIARLGLWGAAAAAAIYVLVKAKQALEAEENAAKSQKDLEEQLKAQKSTIEDHINLLREKNKISEEEQVRLIGLLDIDQKRAGAEVLRVQGSKEEQDAVEKLQKLRRDMELEGLQGIAKEAVAARKLYDERAQQIKDLAKQAGGQSNPSSIGALLAMNTEAYQARQLQIDKQRMAQETKDELARFEAEMTAKVLQESHNRIEAAQMEYKARVGEYQSLVDRAKISEDEQTRLVEEAAKKQAEASKTARVHIESTQEMLAHVEDRLAGGLAHALVEVANGSKKAKEAFKDFAISFLSDIAEMILKAEILKLIESLLNYGGGGGSYSDSNLDASGVDALGGVHFAANGLAGVYPVSRPTYFPKFNVVAGEAGREMLTVLARPRMMSIGGMEAVVGNVRNNRLALMNADDAAAMGGGAGGRMGGRIAIEISHSEESKARIIDSSIKGAEVHIMQQMNRDSRLREATKKAVR